MANSAAQLVYLSAPSGGTNPPASTVGYVAADSTTTHALFATSSAPAFRAIGTNDTTPNYFTTDTGVANAYVIAPATAALTQGTVVRFTTANANTGASTINVNGTGVLSLTKNGTTTALNLGDILSGVVYTAIYDGAEWQLTNPSTGPVSPLIFYSSNQTAAVGSSAVPFSTTSEPAGTYFGGNLWSPNYWPITMPFVVQRGATSLEVYECDLDYAFGVQTTKWVADELHGGGCASWGLAGGDSSYQNQIGSTLAGQPAFTSLHLESFTHAWLY
ncbi:MAG: hypothetical protein ACLPOO_18895 [Terriglobales bacterium]